MDRISPDIRGFSGAERDGVVGCPVRVASPERGATRLVIRVSVAVGAVALCVRSQYTEDVNGTWR